MSELSPQTPSALALCGRLYPAPGSPVMGGRSWSVESHPRSTVPVSLHSEAVEFSGRGNIKPSVLIPSAI